MLLRIKGDKFDKLNSSSQFKRWPKMLLSY